MTFTLLACQLALSFGFSLSFSHMTFRTLFTVDLHWHLPLSRAHMDRLPPSENLRQLTSAELIRFLFLVVNELNNRINAEIPPDFEIISDASDRPPPPPPASSHSHRPRVPRGHSGQQCRWCGLPCSRGTANHGHHSCWAHRNYR